MAEPETAGRARRIPNFRLKVNRTADILDAALIVFANQGLKTGRIEDIARQIGKSKSAILYHYPSKTVLIEVMIAQFCLPDMGGLEDADPDTILREALLQDTPQAILSLVLRAEDGGHDFSQHYRSSLIKTMTWWFPISVEEAAQRVDAVLMPLVYEAIFLPKPEVQAFSA